MKIKRGDKMKTMYDYFKFGDTLYGFCNGYFGDDYENKVCVLVTQTYAVFEYENKNAVVLNLDEMTIPGVDLVNRWKMEK